MRARSRLAVQGAVLVAVLLIGLAAGFGFSRAGGGDSLPAVDADPAAEPAPLATPEGEPVAGTEEAGAREVIGRFVDAEADRDWEASFALLTPEDQETLGPEAVWVRSHASTPPFTGVEVTQVRRRDGQVEVVSDVTLRSSLDAFVGLVPARGRMVWVVEEVQGRWSVAFSRSTLEPRYPDDGDAAEAARSWAQGRQDCDPDVREHAQLIGAPSLALALCGADGRIEAGAPQELEEGEDASAFVAAYGPEIFDWARVVPVTGPVPLRAVLGPVDDRWTVIGVLRR